MPKSGPEAYKDFLDFTRQMDEEEKMLHIAEICANAGKGLDPQSAAYDAAIRKALKESGRNLKTVPLEEAFGKPKGDFAPTSSDSGLGNPQGGYNVESAFVPLGHFHDGTDDTTSVTLMVEMPSADEAVSKGKPSSEVAKNVSDKPSVDKGDLKQKLRAKIAAKATNRMNKQ